MTGPSLLEGTDLDPQLADAGLILRRTPHYAVAMHSSCVDVERSEGQPC